MRFFTRKGRHQATPAAEPQAAPAERAEVGLFATEDNPHVGPVAPERHAWRKKGSWAHTPPPWPVAGPEPIPEPRPYVPEPPAPPIPSPVREFELLTARASNFKYKLPCACGHEHRNTNVNTFRDLYISAENAGWQQDLFRTWRCPRCARRHQASFGVCPVAAIEAAV